MQKHDWKSATKFACALAIVLLSTVLMTQPTQAQTFNVIYSFTGGSDGASPRSALTVDGAENLFGTTFAGGAGYGTVFQLRRTGSGWLFTPLYRFAGGVDGAGSFLSPVVFGPDGALYGTTVSGGTGGCTAYGYSGCGTVFRLSVPPAAQSPWTETVLYRFTGRADGVFPFGEIVFDQAGSILATTNQGGDQGNCYGPGCGTIFKLVHSGSRWTKSILYNFGAGNDGGLPIDGVILDAVGNLYGTTAIGGASNQGAIFQLTPSGSGWSENTLYSFQAGSDGNDPYAGLIFDRSGNLYGATNNLGLSGGGTAFQLTPSGGNWTFNLLYSFSGVPGNEGGPDDKLVMDSAGNLYGTTVGDGANLKGSVFKLTPSGGGWTYMSLHDFTGGADGGTPYGTLALDASGDIYGTASTGGANGKGIVFEITP